MIIEIDGDSHYEDGAKERDAIREFYLKEKGFSVLRFSNDAAKESTGWVLTEIAQFLCIESYTSPHPNPPPTGEGELLYSKRSRE